MLKIRTHFRQLCPFKMCHCVLPDVTAVCILEAFQNQQSMLVADRVLKQLGKEKAKEKYKVRRVTRVVFVFGVNICSLSVAFMIF